MLCTQCGEVDASDEYRDFDRAAWHLEESLKAARAVGARLDVARSYLSGARISLIKGDRPSSRRRRRS